MNHPSFCWFLYLLTKSYFFLLLWILHNLWFNSRHHLLTNRRDWSDSLLSGCLCQRLSQPNPEMSWDWNLWPLLPSVGFKVHKWLAGVALCFECGVWYYRIFLWCYVTHIFHSLHICLQRDFMLLSLSQWLLLLVTQSCACGTGQGSLLFWSKLNPD